MTWIDCQAEERVETALGPFLGLLRDVTYQELATSPEASGRLQDGVSKVTQAMVDRLEERGRVVRSRSLVDRRRRELHLTPEGQIVLRKAETAIQRHEARFTSRLTKSQLENLIMALRAIHRQA